MTEPIQLHLHRAWNSRNTDRNEENNQKHENFRTQEEDPIIITTQ